MNCWFSYRFLWNGRLILNAAAFVLYDPGELKPFTNPPLGKGAYINQKSSQKKTKIRN